MSAKSKPIVARAMPKIHNLLKQGKDAPLADTEVLRAILAELQAINRKLDDREKTPRQRDAAARHRDLRELAAAIGAEPTWPGAGDLLAALTYSIAVPPGFEALRDKLAQDPATPRSHKHLLRILTDNGHEFVSVDAFATK